MATWTEWFDTGLKETKSVLELRDQIEQLDKNTNPTQTTIDAPVTGTSFTSYLPFIGLGVLVLILFKGKK